MNLYQFNSDVLLVWHMCSCVCAMSFCMTCLLTCWWWWQSPLSLYPPEGVVGSRWCMSTRLTDCLYNTGFSHMTTRNSWVQIATPAILLTLTWGYKYIPVSILLPISSREFKQTGRPGCLQSRFESLCRGNEETRGGKWLSGFVLASQQVGDTVDRYHSGGVKQWMGY